MNKLVINRYEKIAKELAFEDCTISIALEEIKRTCINYVNTSMNEEEKDYKLINLNKKRLNSINSLIDINNKIVKHCYPNYN